MAVATAAFAAGCKRDAVSSGVPQPTATTQHGIATTVPATLPAEPASSLFTINGQIFSFPTAKLVAKPTAGGLRVTLFSDDPPEAVRDTYRGNSFYFRFTLDSADAAGELDGQQYVFRNSFTEDDDTTDGIFIAGGKQTLRPMDVSVVFEKVDGELLTHVGGTFKLTDDQTGPDAPVSVRVQSDLEPVVVEAAKK